MPLLCFVFPDATVVSVVFPDATVLFVVCVVFPDATVVCDVLTGTDDGLLSLPLDKTSIPPTFGSPKKLIAGKRYQ